MSRVLLNTLFLQSEGIYARLDGDTVRVEKDQERILQAPLLHLGGIVCFEGAMLSSGLMARCAADGREITYLDYSGRFQFRVEGPTSGNVLLRLAQYNAYANERLRLELAKPFVAGKLRNSRALLLRAARETRVEEDAQIIQEQAAYISTYLETIPDVDNLDALRGLEGQAASCYFASFGRMISRDKADFAFAVRTRRPPRDRTNAVLSFLYALLTSDCVAACESVGLDPQFGFLHALRPGRPALALDLMEEFRSPMVDRLALAIINRRQIHPQHFDIRKGESVLLNDDGRKVVLTAYQQRKQEEVRHPLLKQRVPIGIIPHLQARLLSRVLRNDAEAYVPYIVR